MLNDEKSVLLVEDNPDDEFLTLHAFQKSNIANRIDVVRDGAEALDFLFGTGKHAGRDLSRLPSVVLLDLNLPKLSGLTVLERIRANERTKLLPVVVLTTSVDHRDLLKSYGLGCNSYTRKPVDLEQFIESVRQLGQYWLVVNEPPPLLS